MNRIRSNDPCWCGSRRKFKRCHGDHQRADRRPVTLGTVSEPRTVPAHIVRPPYVEGPLPTRAGPQVLNGERLERMRTACRVAAEVLRDTGAAVAPGVTTDELDAVAHEAYVRRGAYPSTLHYKGFRKSICTSVNEVVCHGIPDDRPLRAGDIVNVDVTAYIDGMHGDTSATFAVGELDDATEGLVATTCEATYRGIHAVVPGRDLREIGRAIETFAVSRGFAVVRDYGGHGIGSAFHADPHVGHIDVHGEPFEFIPGTCFTVEPMLNAGTHLHTQWADGWTEATDDLLPSAQFEHTVVVTDDSVEILTVTTDGDTAVRWPNAGVVGTAAAAR